MNVLQRYTTWPTDLSRLHLDTKGAIAALGRGYHTFFRPPYQRRVVGVKRLVLLSAMLGAAVFFLAYVPITVINVNISTGNDDTAPSGATLSGTGEVAAGIALRH